MNTLERLGNKNNVTMSLRDSRESLFGKPLLDFFSQETPFYKMRFREEESCFRWELEVPGLTKENLTMRIEGRSMLVWGKEKKAGDTGFSRTLFHHSFRVPSTADARSVVATCRNGVLRISIAKLKPKQVHKTIRVQGEEQTVLTAFVNFRKSMKERAQRFRQRMESWQVSAAFQRSLAQFSFRTSATRGAE